MTNGLVKAEAIDRIFYLGVVITPLSKVQPFPSPCQLGVPVCSPPEGDFVYCFDMEYFEWCDMKTSILMGDTASSIHR